MKQIFSGISKFIAFLLAISFVILVPLLLFIFNAGRVLFDPPYIKNLLTDIVVESDLLPAGLAWFSETVAKEREASGEAQVGIKEPDIVDLMGYMTIADWRKIKDEILTRDILASFVSETVDPVYVWIDSIDRVPRIILTMNLFTERANSDHGTRSIEIAFNALPPCDTEQIEDFKARLAAVPAGTEVLYNLCLFPEPWFEDQFNDYLDSLQNVVDEIPPQLNVTTVLARGRDQEGMGPERIKDQLRFIRYWYQQAPILIGGLLILILVFGIRSLAGLGKWWGIPMLLGGLLALILTLVYRVFVTVFMSMAALSETPELVMEEAQKGIIQIGETVFRPMTMQSIGILAAGSVLLVFIMIATKKQDNQ